MASNLTEDLRPYHPSPEEWLIPSRIEALKRDLLPVSRLLKISGHYKSVLSYWIRLQVSSEVELPSDEKSSLLAELKPKWLEKNNTIADFFDESDIETKLLTTPSVSKWCEEQWGHRVDTLYLKRKSGLDLASCNLITVENKDLANELYHRLKAREETFASLCNIFTPENHGVRGSYYKLQSLESLPLGLGKVLGRLNVGSVSQPLPLGKKYCIVQLDQYLPCKLDSRVRMDLLAEQFMLWSDNMVHSLMVVLESNDLVNQSVAPNEC